MQSGKASFYNLYWISLLINYVKQLTLLVTDVIKQLCTAVINLPHDYKAKNTKTMTIHINYHLRLTMGWKKKEYDWEKMS